MQREDELVSKKSTRLASNLPDTDNVGSGKKSLLNFGKASFVFDKHIG